MKILIIGGAGFVGSNLVRHCLREPANAVTVLDSLEPRLHASTVNLREVWPRIQFVRGSMGDEPLISELVQGQDVIFNCAAQTSHPISLRDPLFDAEINCLGNLKLLEAVRLLNPEATVIYTSSSTVIGRAEGDLVDEDHGERPLDIYSANKGVAEKYYRIYNRVHGLKTIVLRFANLYGLYGKGSPDFGFVNYFISLAWAGEEIKIYEPGDQMRNLLYVEDACDILVRAPREKSLIGETFFAVHDEHWSVRQIAETIVRVLGRGRLTAIPWPDERKRIDVRAVSISGARLRSLTGWKPRFGLEDALAEIRAKLERKESH